MSFLIFLIKHTDFLVYDKASYHDISFQCLNQESSDPYLIDANGSVGFQGNKKRIWFYFVLPKMKARWTVGSHLEMPKNWVKLSLKRTAALNVQVKKDFSHHLQSNTPLLLSDPWSTVGLPSAPVTSMSFPQQLLSPGFARGGQWNALVRGQKLLS